MSSLLEHLPNLTEHKGLLARLLALVLLVFAVSYATSHLFLAYSERQEKLDQIAMMKDYLGKWKEKRASADDALLRPVAQDRVDTVQTGIIFHVQSLKLSMEGLKEVAGKKETNGKSYELEFSGPYPETVQCLEGFRSKDALIGIQGVSMSMREGKIHTRMTYKIYTK